MRSEGKFMETTEKGYKDNELYLAVCSVLISVKVGESRLRWLDDTENDV